MRRQSPGHEPDPRPLQDGSNCPGWPARWKWWSAVCVADATLNEKVAEGSIRNLHAHLFFGTLQRGRGDVSCWAIGACHVGTVARACHCGSIRATQRCRCATPSQPEFSHSGPGSEFRAHGHVQSADAPPNGNVVGAIGPVIADPLNANRFFIGTPAGGIWRTSDGGATWTPLTDQQASLSIASLALDPTDPNRNTLIAGTGLTANGSVCAPGVACLFTGSGGLRNGLLYSKDGGNTWIPLGVTTLAGQTVDAVAARGNVIIAGTFESSFAASAVQRRTGGLYRSPDGGTTFNLVSGTAGLPLGPVSSIAGDPNNPNRILRSARRPPSKMPTPRSM